MQKTALLLALIPVLWFDPVQAQTPTPAKSGPPKILIMEATAFTRAPQPTAAGTGVHDGTVAADTAILPLGTRIRITGTASYDGYYLVTDTGAAVKGMHIDIYVPSQAEAKQFGTKRVRVAVLQIGKGPADARRKDATNPPAGRGGSQ
jgi:3D (Asp-Asp-Asp) domain-containing protein